MFLKLTGRLRPIRAIMFMLNFLIWHNLVAVSECYAQQPVASFNMSNSQGCVPFNVQFTNTSQNAVSYIWHFGNGNSSTLFNPVNVYSTSGVFNITLTVTSASGLTHTISQQVTVLSKPVADFYVSQQSGCQGSQVFNFTNTSLNYDSCSWDFGDGTTSSLTNPNHIYNFAGIFNVTLVVYRKSMGCSDVKIRNSLITVLPLPSAVLSVNDSVTCDKNFQFQFSAQMNNVASWNWNFGDGNSSVLQVPSHIYADTGLFQVNIALSGSNGCSTTVRLPSGIHIKWNPLPVATISSDSGCMPHTLSFSTAYFSNAFYNWNIGPGVNRTGHSVYHTYADSGMYPVSLNVNYSNGCNQSVTTGPVRVLSRPFFSFWPVNHTGCAPLTVQFANQPQGNYTWFWEFGDGNTSTQQLPVHNYANQGVYPVKLTATGSNGCSYGYIQSRKVTVNGSSAAFVPDVVTGCPPLLVNFNNNSQNAAAYLWDFGNGDTSTHVNPSYTYSSSGLYSVSLIAFDASGCRDTFIYPVKINVSSPSLNYNPPPPITGCAPFPINFADASGAASYLWDFGDGSTSTASNPYHVYMQPGIYTVALTTVMPNGGCERHIPNLQTLIIDAAQPGFVYSVSPCPPYQVSFTDTSLNAVSWNWNFGWAGTSNQQNPVMTFPGPGTYSVSLSVTTPGGCVTTLQAINSVLIEGLGAQATVFCTDTSAPFTAQFYANSSNATWWLWDFGDGTTSSLENPQHTFLSTGPFTISLTIGNDSCQYTYVYPPVNFGGGVNSGGGLGGGGYTPPPPVYHCAPYSVSFVNPVPGALSYIWDFGDGTTSTDLSVDHVYEDSGKYVVMLYVFNSDGTIDTIPYSDTIYIVEPIRDFAISTTYLCTGVIVNVSSSQDASSYLWDFGAGNTNSTASASHIYPNVNANYMITLNVVDSNNCSSYVAKSFSVNSSNPIKSSIRRGCAGESVSFDVGNMNFASYTWDFGDGNSSFVRNPVHTYADSGIYLVSLSVTDINGCSLQYNIDNPIEIFNPVANFTYTTPVVNCQVGTVIATFNNLSTGSNSWFWDFGDGKISTQFSPSNAYYTSGNHSVTLIARKSVCADTLIIPNAVYGARLAADFTYSVTSDCVPAIIQCTDRSFDAVSWYWNFGDGDTSFSQNPAHTYNVNPRDSITLTVKSIYNCPASFSLPAPQLTAASFSVLSSGGCAPFNAQFADSSSNALNYFWQFGDGNSTTGYGAAHTYSQDGFYDVSLVVTGFSGCSDTLKLDSLIEVNTPSAGFMTGLSHGCAPLLVNFIDSSKNAVKWIWDLGNGSISVNSNPSLIYTIPGLYSVSQIVEGKFGCRDTVIADGFVNVSGAIPDFTVSSDSGCAPLIIRFTNNSTGASSFIWNFGDGSKDSISDPVHIYASPGTFTPTLFVYDSTGCQSSVTWPFSIQVAASTVTQFSVFPLSGCAPLKVSVDNSGTQADSLKWYMGDGTVVHGNNPIHLYTAPGSYLVSLVASNSEGCSDSVVYTDTIFVYEQPHADFISDSREGCTPFSVHISDITTGPDSLTYFWNFGNGSVDSVASPITTYISPGMYAVSLIVISPDGCADTVSKPDWIKVYDPSPPSIPAIKNVTVTPQNSVRINWSLTSDTDLSAYILLKYNNTVSGWDTLSVIDADSIYPGLIPFVLDTAVDVTAISYVYKLWSIDKCGSVSDSSMLIPHRTILLKAFAGHQSVRLMWSAYGDCSIDEYEVWRSDDDGLNYSLVGSVNSSTLEFTDSSAVCAFKYIYKIAATGICGSVAVVSESNRVDATPTSDVENQFSDVLRATVLEPNSVLVEWQQPNILPDRVSRYDIYRSSDQINYELIASVPAKIHEYTDSYVPVDFAPFYYKVSVRNICNSGTKDGLVGSSILLQQFEFAGGALLKWTRYVDWDSGVEYYVVQKLGDDGNWQEVDRVTGSTTEWEEQ